MSYGLTATGFVIKPTQAIRESIADYLGTEVSPTVKELALRDDTLEGHWAGAFSAELELCWEALEVLYSSRSRDAATDVMLEEVNSLTGTIRREAKPSEVTLTLTGDDGTVVTESSRASGPTGEWSVSGDTELEELTAWQASTAYSIGDRVSNDNKSYVCTVAGTSAGSGGPTHDSGTAADGGATWRYMGNGTADADAKALCTVNGPTTGVAHSITEIETPISGWKGVINLEDATPGRLVETDEDYRVRGEEDLEKPGTGTVDAIRQAILDLDGVTACTVFENTSDVTDGDGLPPHSIEALVQGGADQDIWDTLLANAVVATHGDQVGTAVDSEGTSHTEKFSRPTEIDVYVDIELTYEAGEYAGDDAVKAAIVKAGEERGSGRDVTSSRVSKDAFVAGVLDVTVADIGTSPNPSTATTVAVGKREIAAWDTSRIAVVSSSGTP